MELTIRTCLAICLIVAVMLAVLPASANAAGNFSALRNMDELRPSVGRGELVRVMLMPRSLGGDVEEDNFAYLTPEAAKAKADIDAIVKPLAAARKVSFYRARTRYKGDSIVPSEVLITVEGPKVMRYRIKVW